MKGCFKKHGQGKVVFQVLSNASVMKDGFQESQPVMVHYTSPLKFLLPRHTGKSVCRWIYPITYGGGLVGGDAIDIDMEVGRNCCCLLTSQESMKIYHCEGESQSHQTFHGTIKEGALLCIIPDYVVCYKNARYKQIQMINMEKSSNLIVLDWLTAGRVAREELWDFTSYFNKIVIKVDGEVVLQDNTSLSDKPFMSIKQAMRGFQVTGTCIILGQKITSIADKLYKKYSRVQSFGESFDSDTIVSVSRVDHAVGISGVYIRFLATNTSKGYSVIKEIVNPLIPILGADPFENKY